MRKIMYLMGVLEDTDIDWLTGNGAVLRVGEGSSLIRQGQPVDSLFVLLEGGLSVEVAGKQITKLSVGEIVGEISFVDSRPPGADVRANQDSIVLGIPTDRLKTKLHRDKAFAANFYKAVAVFLADRLRSTTSRLGYGKEDQDSSNGTNVESGDELGDELLDVASLATARFNKMLKFLKQTSPG